MLIIGQPDKMLKDLRNSKGSTQLSAMSIWIVGSGDIIMFRIFCFHSVCHSAWSRYEIQQGRNFIAPTAHTSCWGKHNLKACHTTSSYGFQARSTFTNIFLYPTWLYTNILKPTLHLFLHSGHLNRYMHHHSLAPAEPLLCGEI